MAIWDDVITESEKKIYQKCGYAGKKLTFGTNLALLIIDVTYNFVGDKPEPILKSIERFPLSCGEEGWKAVHQTSSLLPIAREKNIPIIYSASLPSIPLVPWRKRNPRAQEIRAVRNGNEIIKEIAPLAKDIVIYKPSPSVFLGTTLLNVLITLKIDTLLCCGGVTSGCVRATVVDAASYGYVVGVIEECTFDRGQTTHKVNLFDMDAKYASVISVNEVKDYLAKLPGNK